MSFASTSSSSAFAATAKALSRRMVQSTRTRSVLARATFTTCSTTRIQSNGSSPFNNQALPKEARGPSQMNMERAGENYDGAIDIVKQVTQDLGIEFPSGLSGSSSSSSSRSEGETQSGSFTSPHQVTPIVGSGPKTTQIYTANSLPPKTDPTLEFLVNLLMKDGKKAQSERHVSSMLRQIQTMIQSDPLPLVKRAIEEVRPLVKMQSRKQGGKTLQVPVALGERQSVRKALVWIMEASKKRNDREIHKRLAAEFLAVIDGSSNALARKEEAHRIATLNRANASVRI
ncbi:ribosomal protein S7 [Violaceomyces palustris]|uniref:Ribosomal protein S7 n=1 Tax=Violaceomyces palustris TaxID=1673888 RepID=A0ACD0NPC0_9BASI|nr:ribosomal protein S7 [Violaceomyces palustris]